MKFEIEMDDKTIHEAARLVVAHFKDHDFLFEVKHAKKFNLTGHTNAMVAQEIEFAQVEMKIKPYKTWSPWSSVIGYASGNTVYVNTRKLNLPLKDRVQNFMHEPLHLLGYSHKGNKVNAFNLGTVPYKVSAIFVKYLESIGKL